MRRNVSRVVRDVGFVGSSNLFSLAITTIGVFVIPKLVSQDGYGYWQLYLFYTAYVGFFHFGWVDGVYLRYGGRAYGSLDRPLMSSQFLLLLGLELVLALCLSVGAAVFLADESRRLVLMMTACCLVLINLRNLLLYVLQITGRLRIYSRILIVDRAAYCVLILGLLANGARTFQWLVLADLIGKCLSLGCAMWACRDLVFSRPVGVSQACREAGENLRVGSKLLVANIASLVIVGIVRVGIEQGWDIATFGKVSLALSVSNLLMVFVNALGVVVYPMLRRARAERLPGIYVGIRGMLMMVLLAGMIVYHPLRAIIGSWLPGYSDALKYMAILLPLCLFEGRVAILVNPFFNTLRRERDLMWINLLMVAVSALSTVVSTVVLHSLDLAVVSILVLAAMRCTIAEALLVQSLGLRFHSEWISEFLLLLVFVIASWFCPPIQGLVVYLGALVAYLILERKRLVGRFSSLRRAMRAE